MIFGVLNPEKIWHQQLIHLPTSPVHCSHFTLGNPKKSFFNSIIHSCRLFTLSHKKTNCYPFTHRTWKMSPHYQQNSEPAYCVWPSPSVYLFFWMSVWAITEKQMWYNLTQIFVVVPPRSDEMLVGDNWSAALRAIFVVLNENVDCDWQVLASFTW